MRMGQNDDERSQCANKAYELDPKYAELSSGMAHLHMDNENYEEALWYMQTHTTSQTEKTKYTKP